MTIDALINGGGLPSPVPSGEEGSNTKSPLLSSNSNNHHVGWDNSLSLQNPSAMNSMQDERVINGLDFVYNPADFESDDEKTTTDNAGNTPGGNKDVNIDLYSTTDRGDPNDYETGTISKLGKVPSMPADSSQNRRQNGVRIKERGAAKVEVGDGDATLGIIGQGAELFSDY